MKYFICYDIEDNKDRYHLVKYLESFAYRLQYSVFECELSMDELREKQAGIEAILAGVERPKLTMIPVCRDCSAKIWQIGAEREAHPQECIVL